MPIGTTQNVRKKYISIVPSTCRFPQPVKLETCSQEEDVLLLLMLLSSSIKHWSVQLSRILCPCKSHVGDESLEECDECEKQNTPGGAGCNLETAGFLAIIGTTVHPIIESARVENQSSSSSCSIHITTSMIQKRQAIGVAIDSKSEILSHNKQDTGPRRRKEQDDKK
jgi:hypothetical protein